MAKKTEEKKIEEYEPVVREGIPFPAKKTRYHRKMRDGALQRLGETLKPGQSVVLPFGSISKVKPMVEARGFKTISSVVESVPERILWVLQAEE